MAHDFSFAPEHSARGDIHDRVYTRAEVGGFPTRRTRQSAKKVRQMPQDEVLPKFLRARVEVDVAPMPVFKRRVLEED